MLQIERWLRALIACALLLVSCAQAIAGTCPASPGDLVKFHTVSTPVLSPGVPSRIVFRAENTGTTTWRGEGNQPFPYRLGATSANQLTWSNFSCGGYGNNPTDQRAHLCSDVGPGSSVEFSFDITAPHGVSSAVLGVDMLQEAGTACDGWFRRNASLVVSVNGNPDTGPSCNTTAGPADGLWLLEVWNNQSFAGNPVERRNVGPVGLGGFNLDLGGGASTCSATSNYSTRMTRTMYLPAGNYTFRVHGDDGVRFSIGGQTYINEWRDPQFADFTVNVPITGGLYALQVEHYQAQGGSGVSLDWDYQPTGGGAPDTPSGLSANGGDGRVDLFWAGANGANSYNIKRSTTSGGGFVNIGTTPSTSFTDFGVTNGQTYYYVVTASNGNGESGPSSQASATPNGSAPSCSTTDTVERDDAWLLEIYNNTELVGEPVERRYEHIGEAFNFNWTGNPPSNCVGDQYSVRFKRYVTFPQTGTYRFNYRADDGMRAMVAGLQIFNRWAIQVVTDSAEAPVNAGRQLVQVEYFQGGGGAQAELSWNFVGGGGNPTRPNAPTGLRANGGNGRVELAWNATPSASVYHIKRSTTDVCCWNEIAQTSSTSYTDTGVTNGTTYYYVVTASNSAGESEQSNQAAATPQAPVAQQPDVKIEITDSAGAVIPSGSSLTLNADGWPSPNPLHVKVTLSCPSDRPQGCDDGLMMLFNSPDERARMHGKADENKCLFGVGNLGDPHYRHMQWVCNDGPVAAGQSKSFLFRMIIQPSEAATFAISANWGGLKSAQANVGIPLAQIHPLVVLPGILGTMPPWVGAGMFDPVLGVYDPMMRQLDNLGYDNQTVFRMPYNWRKSNRITARFLRDRIREALAASSSVPWVNKDGKVDLMVHSMGGLVTRSYVQGFGYEENGAPLAYNNDIRKVVFVATPHRGFPETYKTYESGSWSDYLMENFWTFGPWQAMDNVFWPAFVHKNWREAHPWSIPPIDCDTVPGSALPLCKMNEYAMTHEQSPPGAMPVLGIESLREMLPTDDSDQYFGPYLCGAYTNGTCTNPYPHGKTHNPLLNALNAGVGSLDTLLGSENIYVIYGTDPESSHHTDVVYDVAPPPAGTFIGRNGWANGTPEVRIVAPAGDDLIPEYSLNLKLLLPSIPAQNVAKLVGNTARHKEIMWNDNVQSVFVPRFLAGMGTVPMTETYRQPHFLIDPHQWWTLAALCPVNLLLTDSQGRRLGYDPATGQTLNEIPGMYAAPNSENQIMILKDPAPGTYTLTVSAFGSGPFNLALNQIAPEGTPRRWVAEGTVNAGDTLQYTITIDPQLPITQQAPVANAGPDQNISAGDACNVSTQLDGSASTDPDGEALNYYWSGPFESATSVRPTVTLPVGSHEIRLVVMDGQGGGSEDKVQVTVTANSPEVKSIKVEPEVLEPADNSMRDVKVLIDATEVCGRKPTCRIKKIESDEGDKKDYQIVDALKAKLRAERSGDGDGRTYKLKIECDVPGGKKIDKTVSVKVRPPGRMKGKGEVKGNGRMHKFEFDVWESKGGKDSGHIKVDARKLDFDEDEDRKPRTEKFRSTKLYAVTFRNDDDYKPGDGMKVDTVTVYGEGEFNGKSGYKFEMRASDTGEPGEDRDYLKFVVRDAGDKKVMSIDEKIDDGNNQSIKPPK